MMRKVLGVLVLVSAAAWGCADKAEPSFTRGEDFERKGDLGEARVMYEKAVAEDATSTHGKLAAQKLKDTEAAFQVWKTEQAEKKAKKDAEAVERRKAEQAAQAARLAALRQKISPKWWGFDPDGECQAKGLPPYRKTYEGGLYAENEAVAVADGCRHLFAKRIEPSLNDNIFCCPR